MLCAKPYGYFYLVTMSLLYLFVAPSVFFKKEWEFSPNIDCNWLQKWLFITGRILHVLTVWSPDVFGRVTICTIIIMIENQQLVVYLAHSTGIFTGELHSIQEVCEAELCLSMTSQSIILVCLYQIKVWLNSDPYNIFVTF